MKISFIIAAMLIGGIVASTLLVGVESELLAVLLLASPAYAEGSGTIAGAVVDAKDGKPLSDAVVIILGTRLGTPVQANGEFVIENVPEGTYSVRAAIMAYATETRNNVVVTPNQTTKLEFRLKAAAEFPPANESDRDKSLHEATVLARSGNYDAAIQKLEGLYASYPDDAVVVSGLFSALVEVKRYDRAEAVMKKFVERRPMDPKGLGDLASLYLISGRKEPALDILERLIKIAPDETWTYQSAFSILWRSGALDETVAMITRGRKATGDSTLLAGDAAQVYRSLSRYDAATMEYLLAVVGERDPEIAADGIVEMAQNAEARETIVGALNAAAGRQAFEQVARTCLWQIHLLGADCQRAFEQISILARDKKVSPEILSNFAAKSQAKGCNRECAEVFNLALALPENKADFPLLMFSKGGCELRAGLPDQAIATYNEVVRRYPDSKWACDAQVALGKIYHDQGRLEDAIAQADKVIAAKYGGDAKYDAILFKGDCLVSAGNLDDAFTAYDLVGTDWKPNFAQEAFYNLGEIRFYQANFEDALSYYNVTLKEYADEPRANDAIERLLLLKAAKGDLAKLWLKDFAQAALLRRQGRIDEAVVLLTKRADEAGQGPIKIESLRSLAAIERDRGDFEGAIKMYKLIGETLDTYFSPSALEAVGDVYLKLGKAPEAIQTYEEVILKYPNSVSAGEARRKIDVAKREAQSAPSQAPENKP
jgi:tetratricopeptide (TPR) repeat protein